MRMMLALSTVFDSRRPGEDIPLFIFQFAPLVKSATARKVADDTLSDVFFKI